MKEVAKKEIERISIVVDQLSLSNEKAIDLFNLIKSYYKDAKYFFDEGRYLKAFEAAIIVWAYIDAGLHLGVFNVPKRFKDLFTV